MTINPGLTPSSQNHTLCSGLCHCSSSFSRTSGEISRLLTWVQINLEGDSLEILEA
ncbi:hypothetical protein C1H46_019203 [Malus baccata]|uniref:Uncharacterized protein n=1 Tax=Malus baccata TaxID=106549 RepID=A0A540M8V4_MALBA|nr:hypothetical protein C1H46_019203 [Malus baccata]